MILLSINIRGIGGGPKRTAFKHVLDSHSLAVVFLQETMSLGANACDYFLRLRSSWRVCARDASRLSSGILVAWNPLVADFRAFDSVVGILLKGNFLGFKEQVHMLNIYGLYTNRRAFWELSANNGLLNLPKLILEGDLNFTWSSDEVWGNGQPIDTLDDFFITLFSNPKLQDISPCVLSPTWSNGRVGSLDISKKLDRFFYA